MGNGLQERGHSDFVMFFLIRIRLGAVAISDAWSDAGRLFLAPSDPS